MAQLSDARKSRVFQEALKEDFQKGYVIGYVIGYLIGREEGIVMGREEVALRMLGMKYSIAFVAKATGFSAQKVRALKKKLPRA